MNRSRRRFLGGAAVAIALPPLPSLLGDRAYADAMASRKRVLTVFAPNGVYYPEWPKAGDGGLDGAPLLEPLAAVRGKVNVLTNLANLAGVPSDGTGDHAAGTGAAFTAVKAARADGAGIRAGVSLDQAAARHLKQFTRLASLQFGVLPGKQASVCEFGYACLYENCISWLDDTQALPPIYNPRAAFEQLFAGLDPASSAANQALRLARRKSVLDYVREETATLKGKLGRSDGLKLEQMLTGIGDLDRKLRALSSGPRCGGEAPADPGDDLDARGKLFNDVIVAAFQCDVTRVISHILAPPFPDIGYTFLGAASGHHAASHWFDEGQENDYRKICRWHLRQLGDLLGKLDAVPEGAGTLLDGTFVVQTSDCGYSHTHDHTNLPVVIAGGAGRWKTGRHVVYPPSTPIANLFVSVLNAVGVPTTRFGQDGTRPLENL
jgi:Protein of unknown function (DUF1552)